MATEDQARSRLAAEMERRRVALRMQWDEVAKAADMSPAHLRRIRKNETSITPLMEARLETALAWDAGSIHAILQGGAPTPPTAEPGSLPALKAQAEGTVAPPDGEEADPPTTPALADLLKSVDARLAEMNDQLAQQREQIAWQSREIKELRREQSDEDDRRRKGA